MEMELVDISKSSGTNTTPHIVCCEALEAIKNGGQRTEVSNGPLKPNPLLIAGFPQG
jgi:hypothetical protein